ncbi:hypothetical protein PISL3812_09377 [Talaromyces islandicus]|uniref:Serine aminopeptidase S33 domain-containing protein n=1 Tax=Talaromyces islandicus TaxID=28573 RepID=A0A0U1MBE3_TALIS|nr:hypothetical protein PISL3812_09377 [Talaromyces islandicus]
MSSEQEGSLVLPDGTKLYTKTWKPEGIAKAIIAFYHGFSDHCNSWYQFFPNLVAAGFEVHSLDQRGWGESSASDRKLRGDYGTTAVVMADLHFFLQSLTPFTREGSIPLFLMGHSMGGMNSLYYALNPESPYHTAAQKKVQLAGVVSIAPLVMVHPTTQPLKIIEYAGRIVAKVVPKWTMVQDIDPVWVSRDEAVVEAIRKDGRLCHRTGTFEALAAMLARGAWLDGLYKDQTAVAGVADAVPPLLVAHGTADRITWFDATKRMVEAVPLKDKTFKEYDGAYHKLTNDTHGVAEQFTADVVEWMNSKVV